MNNYFEKCIFCPAKKPNTMVKYKWEAVRDYYKATKSHHYSPYLEREFDKKQFWRPEAKLVEWKIRYQGAKYRPKIKPLWHQLAERGISSSMYCSFTVPLSKEIVEECEE